MKQLKILMDARAMGQRPSGIGMYIYYLVKELQKYNEFSFALITDVTESEEIRELSCKGIKVYSIGKKIGKNFGLFSYYRFVQKCIYYEKPDIFWEGNALVPIKIHNPFGKLFVTLYDMFPLSDPEHFSPVYRMYFKYGVKQTIKNFDKFIYDSYDCKVNAELYFPILKGKDHFVGYVIVPKLPTLPITDNGCFLYVGNLETRKGADILLQAFKLYRQRGGKRGLRIAGKMRDKNIQNLMDEVSMATRAVEYLGYISEYKRNLEYANCHAFLFPSRAEGFGIPIVEVMNYNKPVIAGELTTIKEVTGNCIRFFPLSGDVMECAERLCDLMNKDFPVDENAYQNVIERYTAENVGKRYQEMLVSYMNDYE